MIKNIILCVLGTLGFCGVLNVPKKKIAIILIGAALSGTVYEYAYSEMKAGIFLSTLYAATAVGIYSEAGARIFKTPSTVIFLPSLIPLLPVGTLYYAMSNLIAGRYEQFAEYAKDTVLVGFAIATGSVITSTAVKTITKRRL